MKEKLKYKKIFLLFLAVSLFFVLMTTTLLYSCDASKKQQDLIVGTWYMRDATYITFDSNGKITAFLESPTPHLLNWRYNEELNSIDVYQYDDTFTRNSFHQRFIMVSKNKIKFEVPRGVTNIFLTRGNS